jgi:hypothetical protein
MRNILFVLVVGASACAARPSHPTLAASNSTYACGDASIVRIGDAIGSTRLGWHDEQGDHFVSSVAPVDVEAVEITIPADPRQDAVRAVYDTSKGAARSDWRLVQRQVCTAKGGYSDVLARYLRGESLDQLAHELSLDNRDEAKDAVHTAMLALQKRYYRDR